MAAATEDTIKAYHKQWNLDQEDLSYLDLNFFEILKTLKIPLHENEPPVYLKSQTNGTRILNVFREAKEPGAHNYTKVLGDFRRYNLETEEHTFERRNPFRIRNLGTDSRRLVRNVIYALGGWLLEDYERLDAEDFIKSQIAKGQQFFKQHPEFIQQEYKAGRFPTAPLEPSLISLYVQNKKEAVANTQGGSVMEEIDLKDENLPAILIALHKAGLTNKIFLQTNKDNSDQLTNS
jgi:hypothetical protein